MQCINSLDRTIYQNVHKAYCPLVYIRIKLSTMDIPKTSSNRNGGGSLKVKVKAKAKAFVSVGSDLERVKWKAAVSLDS